MLWPGKDCKAKFQSEYAGLLEAITHIEKHWVYYSAKRKNIQGEMILYLANPNDSLLWDSDDLIIPVKHNWPADLAALMSLLDRGGMHDPFGFCIYCDLQKSPQAHNFPVQTKQRACEFFSSSQEKSNSCSSFVCNERGQRFRIIR